LKDSAKIFLNDIQKLFKAGVNHVEVQGFSDNTPVSGKTFSSNWDLSGARAVNVVKFMIENGFAPDKFSAVAYGETKPAYPNISPEFRSKNRRVEILVDSPIGQLNLYIKEATSNSNI